MALGRVVGRRKRSTRQRRIGVSVDIIPKMGGEPFCAQACVQKTRGKRNLTVRSCGRAVCARSVQSAVGKSLKMLGQQVALRSKRLSVAKRGRKFRY